MVTIECRYDGCSNKRCTFSNRETDYVRKMRNSSCPLAVIEVQAKLIELRAGQSSSSSEMV